MQVEELHRKSAAFQQEGEVPRNKGDQSMDNIDEVRQPVGSDLLSVNVGYSPFLAFSPSGTIASEY